MIGVSVEDETEGVKNTRKGGLNWVFKTKNFSPFVSKKTFLFLLRISTNQEVEIDKVFYPGSLANHKLRPVHPPR